MNGQGWVDQGGDVSGRMMDPTWKEVGLMVVAHTESKPKAKSDLPSQSNATCVSDTTGTGPNCPVAAAGPYPVESTSG